MVGIKDALDETVFMTEVEALADIRGYASAGRINIVDHARRRMRERGAIFEDVREALITATQCWRADVDRWKVTGWDRDGDALTVVVALED